MDVLADPAQLVGGRLEVAARGQQLRRHGRHLSMRPPEEGWRDPGHFILCLFFSPFSCSFFWEMVSGQSMKLKVRKAHSTNSQG